MHNNSTIFASVQAAAVITFPLHPEGLPDPPPPSLDPLLDAAATCLAALGPTRTTMSDIARELGVAPSTVYRKVGSVENAAWLLCTREAHRFFERLPVIVADAEGARKVTAFIAAGIEAARDHPVFARILRDEPDFVGRGITRRLPAIIDQVADVVGPVLQLGMQAGVIRDQEPRELARWITRIALVALVAPPEGDLQDSLDNVLLPMLAPTGSTDHGPS